MDGPYFSETTRPRFNRAVEAAIHAARQSPCKKSQRGASLFYVNDRSRVVATAHNGLVAGQCTGSRECRSMCAKRCEHAESAVIRSAAMSSPQNWRAAHLLHAKTIDGNLVASGPPSCWQCSRAIIAWGIGYVWLHHDNGWRKYTGLEFHRLTLEHLGLVE